MIRSLIAALVGLLMAGAAPAAPRLLVVAKGDATLTSFDPTTYAKQFAVKVPGEPHVVIVSGDGKLAYLADFEGVQNVLTVVDLDQKAVAATISLKPYYKPHGMAVTRDGSRLFATCEASRVVVEVDLAAGKVSRVFNLDQSRSHLLALSGDEKTLYVTSIEGGNVGVIDVASGEVTRSILSGKGSEGIDIAPDGREIWVVNRVAQTIAVLDADTHKRLVTFSCVTNPIEVRFAPDGKSAAVTCALSGDVAFFDTATRKELGRAIAGAFPLGVTYDATGARCFVTDEQGGDVVVIDTKTRKEVHHFAVGKNPEGILFVP